MRLPLLLYIGDNNFYIKRGSLDVATSSALLKDKVDWGSCLREEEKKKTKNKIDMHRGRKENNKFRRR